MWTDLRWSVQLPSLTSRNDPFALIITKKIKIKEIQTIIRCQQSYIRYNGNIKSKTSSYTGYIPSHQQECKWVQRYKQHFLDISRHLLMSNHTTYIHRGSTSTVYFICKSIKNKENRNDISRQYNQWETYIYV